MTLFQILLFVFSAIDIIVFPVVRISQSFLHEIPKYMRGASYSWFCKFRSSVSGDFEHVSSHFHFSPVTRQGRVIVLEENS